MMVKGESIFLRPFFFRRNGVCPIVGAHNVTYYPDKFADKEIEELKVFCRNKSNGCTWSDKLKFLSVIFFHLTNFHIVSFCKGVFVDYVSLYWMLDKNMAWILQQNSSSQG